ncbi:MAG TPA: efflux RND transporter periplasmic adaptor subunit [Candidatus Dormibacteraeota bacterium]|nr:efflux RND transporter periplasmic adaptor subunit [Candidatus Dormibacteraeota bacterium]
MRLKVLAIVVLLAVAGGAIFFSLSGGLAPAATAATTLLTATASVADVTDAIAATGTVAATTTYTVSFGTATGSTSVTWPVTKVDVAVGDTVKTGQVLATADTTNLDAQIGDAQRAAASALIQLHQATDDRANATTTATKRQTQEALYTAETSYDHAKSDLADLEALRATATLKAPENGIVTAVAITAGSNAPSGAAITMISTELQVTTSVVESDVSSIKVGQQASVAIGALNATLNGKVTSINPVGTSSGSNGVVSFAVEVALDAPPSALLPGMSANVTITAASATGVLSIPSRALSGTAGSYTVRVVADDGTVSTRSVEVGLVTASLAEIKSGLQAGERVVTGTSSTQNAATTTGGGGGVFPGGGVIRGGGIGR